MVLQTASGVPPVMMGVNKGVTHRWQCGLSGRLSEWMLTQEVIEGECMRRWQFWINSWLKLAWRPTQNVLLLEEQEHYTTNRVSARRKEGRAVTASNTTGLVEGDPCSQSRLTGLTQTHQTLLYLSPSSLFCVFAIDRRASLQDGPKNTNFVVLSVASLIW